MSDGMSIVFFCDGHAGVGFGHVHRCLQLAGRVADAGPIGFCGDLDPVAAGRVRDRGFALVDPGAASPRGLAVIDRMFDEADMDAYDRPFLDGLRPRFGRTALITSGRADPGDLPVDVLVGHMLPPHLCSARMEVHAGLAFAPADLPPGLAGPMPPVRERIERIFLGFGGSRDLRGLKIVLAALQDDGFGGQVDVLLSPVHLAHRERLARRPGLRLNVLVNIPSVPAVMRDADLVIGTYGNITFEALALGRPFVAVTVKDFQQQYAEDLARRGLLVAAGRDDGLTAPGFRDLLAAMTPAVRQRLSDAGGRAVDGRGMERVAALLRRQLAPVPSASPGALP